jgi:uncharacterized protein with von Willebrand factor type A (vWA) domain
MLEAHLIETDSYDREAFSRVIRHVSDLGDLVGSGERLLPHFEELIEDLFGLLFKLTVRVRPPGLAPASTALNRRILLATMASEGFLDLKDETALDAARAAHAACDLARRALALIKSGEMLLDDELLAAKSLVSEEERLERNRTAANDLAGRSEKVDKAFAEGVREGERRVEELSSALKRSIEEIPPSLDAELGSTASRLAEDLPRFNESADSFARAIGGSGPRTAGERLRLAEKLERNEKLRTLAAMAGAFRAEARAVRRRRRERAATEVYRVGRGADLSRLLPAEMSALRHPLRRRDFLRRLLEQEIAEYDLRGDDRHGRGPVVVCIDGSGSMNGPRELWAKAVALALLDVARKQGRRTRALVFSGPDTPTSAFDLSARGRFVGRRPVDMDAVIGLAECFPGGGTDFEKPLREALDAVRAGALKGADIVFITDGEAPISEAFAAEVRREKKRRDIGIFAVIVDDPSRNSANGSDLVQRAAKELGKVAERMTTVTELTRGSAREIFEAI